MMGFWLLDENDIASIDYEQVNQMVLIKQNLQQRGYF